ncbi:calcium/calmodulin-dependent protein kinase type IV-like [Ischnura elegans]|uniref:calcium/calmodulin-dependent protein kinase type IV-like n=1 Tax=Ischnura elegans TaxID=197161 RepID=UPI001ED87B76|nr:calcium/calmodulin-dependent protein kinase type IV-like [Ischnura elegans]
MESVTPMADAPWITRRDEKHTRIEEEYILGDIIGRGTTSTIYCCLHKGRTRWACKVIRKRLLDRKAVAAEIPVLLRLRHPNIIKFKDVFETENEVMIVMEMAGGGELFERIVEQGSFSEEDAATAIRQILSALQYLHSHGMAHRDLKPENLLYESENEGSPLKLADSGMSRIMLSERQTSVCESAGFTAPEIILHQENGPPADLWSLGVVLYIILCGYEPFWDDAGEKAIYDRAVHGVYTFDSPCWDGISDSAKDLVSKLLQVDPAKRLTAKEALAHPWVCGETTNQDHMEATQKRLREVHAKRKFRAATHAVLATRRAMALLSLTGSPRLSKGPKLACQEKSLSQPEIRITPPQLTREKSEGEKEQLAIVSTTCVNNAQKEVHA